MPDGQTRLSVDQFLRGMISRYWRMAGQELIMGLYGDFLVWWKKAFVLRDKKPFRAKTATLTILIGEIQQSRGEIHALRRTRSVMLDEDGESGKRKIQFLLTVIERKLRSQNPQGLEGNLGSKGKSSYHP
ncbi:hypothetical protein MRB53_016993 [Persea americana]|uniref:Uncharacterized protein n=1 Tax=Persea americana TaxID=3435 RepID=A0ACC2M3Q8_PERAE|nr:hypothetical protein MRB53_016993 [Persea americana]